MTEKVSSPPLHTLALPVIVPGVAGAVLIVTASVAADELPHVLLAVTETVPPNVFAVVLMLFVVDVPVHPPGSDHVYDVAPPTGVIEKVLLLLAQMLVLPVIVPGVAGAVLIVTVTVNGVPVQNPNEGVTLYVAVIAAAVVLVSVPVTLVLPVPDTPPVRPVPSVGTAHA